MDCSASSQTVGTAAVLSLWRPLKAGLVLCLCSGLVLPGFDPHRLAVCTFSAGRVTEVLCAFIEMSVNSTVLVYLSSFLI